MTISATDFQMKLLEYVEENGFVATLDKIDEALKLQRLKHTNKVDEYQMYLEQLDEMRMNMPSGT